MWTKNTKKNITGLGFYVISTLIVYLNHPIHHQGYSQDREKHHTLLTLIRRYNIVYDVTNVEQHELLGTDMSRPLIDVTPERPYLLAVVEGVQSRFFESTAATYIYIYIYIYNI